MWAARAEIWGSGNVQRITTTFLVSLGFKHRDAGVHVIACVDPAYPTGECQCHRVGVQFAEWAHQLAAFVVCAADDNGALAVRHGIQRILQLQFDDAPFLLNYQHLFEAACEVVQQLPVSRKRH